MNNSQILVPEMLVDSHVHLDFSQFDQDRQEVLQRARAAGIKVLVVPGVRADHWIRVKAVTAADDSIYACYGLHPCFCADHRQQHLDDLKNWAQREQPVAIGECGLDFYTGFVETESEQRLYFESQLSIARESDLPVVLHARRSVDAVLKCLRQAQVHQGVMHSFSGSLQQAKAAIDQGLMIGIGGAVTHQRANKLRGVVAALPLDALLLETDAPDQAGAKHLGMRNEPSFMVTVLDTVAELRSESREKLAAATSENAARLFSITL